MTFVRALTVFLSFGILGCVAISPSTDEGGGRVVTIASDATFAPFHYIDSEGNVTGFDIELARRCCRTARDARGSAGGPL